MSETLVIGVMQSHFETSLCLLLVKLEMLGSRVHSILSVARLCALPAQKRATQGRLKCCAQIICIWYLRSASANTKYKKKKSTAANQHIQILRKLCRKVAHEPVQLTHANARAMLTKH
jgi:hypothetical protein